MNDLISVVVPVYNVEKYLDRCVKSICSQTYKSLEIILVDDGSADRSGLLCDHYSAHDERIKVIHKTNGGLSDARNAGKAVASGKYICFIDADDWIENSILEQAYNALSENNCNLAIWSFCADYVDDQENVLRSITVSTKKRTIDIDKSEGNEFSDPDSLSLVGYAWNKLYNRAMIEDSLFEKGTSLVEDILFNSFAVPCCKRAVFLEQIGTHYIQRNRETLGGKFYPDYYELKIKACKARERLLSAFSTKQKDIAFALERSYFAAIKSSCRMACLNKAFTRGEKHAYMKTVCRSEQARDDLRRVHASGKDFLLKWALLLGQYWVFEVLYGR